MNYNEMMRMMAGRTGLTRRQADRAVTGTLTVLSEAISAKETKDLLAQLPKTLRERVPVTNEVIAMRPIEFVARVADVTETASIDATGAHVRAVFATLVEAVNAGEMSDIAAELGDQFADLLGRPVRSEPNRNNTAELAVPALISGVVAWATGFSGHVTGLVRRPLAAGARLVASRSN